MKKIISVFMLLFAVLGVKSQVVSSTDGWGFGFAKLQEKIELWKASPRVKIDTIGITAGNRPMYQVQISKDGKIDKQVHRIVMHVRTHPSEVQASYVINEVISILLSNSELATILLDSCVFNIIPMYNPDGVEMGYSRENANYVNIETNWNAAAPEKEVVALRALYKSYMESNLKIKIALNVHSDDDCQRFFVVHSQVGTSAKYFADEKRFVSSVRKFSSGEIMNWDKKVSWTSETLTQYAESWFWLNYKDSVMALTYEDMNCALAGNYDKTARALLSGMAEYLNISNSLAVSTNELTGAQLQLYPNPATSGEVLRISTGIANESGSLLLVDSKGAIIYEQDVRGEDGNYLLPVPANCSGLLQILFVGTKNQLASKILIRQ